MPILEIVAGEAHDRSCDSNRKFTLGPNWIRSPEGIVSSLGEGWGDGEKDAMKEMTPYANRGGGGGSYRSEVEI